MMTPSDDGFPEGFVRASRNIMFDRGYAYTRGRFAPSAITTTFTSLPRWGKAFILLDTAYNLIVCENHLFRLNADNSLSAITAASFDMQSSTEFSAASVNGIVLIPARNATYSWDPTGLTTGTITFAGGVSGYRYVTSHISRAVVACANTLAFPGAITVAWSVSGSATDFTSTGSGSTALSDAPDRITGLASMKNILVIPRRKGFHLGYPTGTSVPAFRFETFAREGIGCYYPSTWANDSNIAMFCGHDNVYSFDVSRIRSIGDPIQDELFELLKLGVPYQGFITNNRRGLYSRAHYHLFPCIRTAYAGPVMLKQTRFPHYIYDMQSGAWSRHFYLAADDGEPAFAFNRITSLVSDGVSIITNNQFVKEEAIGECETGYGVRTHAFTIGKDVDVATLHRIALKHRKFDTTRSLDIVVRFRNSEGNTISVRARAAGYDQSDGDWIISWFNVVAVGQFFELDIIGIEDTRLTTGMLFLEYSLEDQYRGPSSNA